MAKLDVNIVTSLVGKGLEREYLLLKSLLNERDVYVNAYHYTNVAGSNFVRADLNVFLEVIMPNVLCLSRRNVLIPNDEWWHPINDQYLDRITDVWCKTHESYRIWSRKVGNKAKYVGFEARDLYDPAIPREERFLHVAGESEFKGTEAVVQAWKNANWSYKPLPLTVVTHQPRFKGIADKVENVDFIFEKVSDTELSRLMNSHRYHVVPSAYEGYGHLIHEGVGCGALVITTGAPPMSEFAGVQSDWGVAPSGVLRRSLAELKQVSHIGIAVSCSKALAATEESKTRRSHAARRAFLDEREQFRSEILRLVGV